ncbi:MAG: MauE/DoxX family redox-associated membrane protein [Acidobacteriota bacterium]
MEEILLFIRILLAGVFVLAGVGKFLDPEGSAKAVKDFGVPQSLSVPLGYALPAAEIFFAVLLLFVSTSWFGAVGASVLLLAFVGGMLWQYSQGKAPDCHCFGQMHSEPVSSKSIARNVVLLSIALLMVVAGRGTQGSPLADTREGMVQTLLLFGLALAAVVALSYLKRVLDSQREISRKIELLELLSTADIPRERQEAGDPTDGLPIGAILPDFNLFERSGARMKAQDLLVAGRPVLFMFVGPNCSPCKALMPEIVEWHSKLAGKVEVVIMTSGSQNEINTKLEIADGVRVLFDVDREFAQSVYAKWTPSAMLMRSDGRVASHIAAGDNAIRALVEKIESADPTDRFLHITNGNSDRKPKIGEAVPDFSLAAVQGQIFSSNDLKGHPTLAVFWSQTCPHCIAMMSELKKWDLEKGSDEPNLVVFSEGDFDDHSELGLRSPIVLEPGYKTATSIGMFGTPSAVLIDEDGVIVSEAAIGAPNIWSLIGKR